MLSILLIFFLSLRSNTFTLAYIATSRYTSKAKNLCTGHGLQENVFDFCFTLSLLDESPASFSDHQHCI